jgi:hypothetical protein
VRQEVAPAQLQRRLCAIVRTGPHGQPDCVWLRGWQ